MRVFKGKKFEVLVEKRNLPNGLQHEVEFVHHNGSAVIVPVLDSGELIMLRQYRPVLGKWIIEFPAGTVEEGETPLQTATRELREETGYDAEDIRELISFIPSPGISDEIMHVFLARGLRPSRSDPEAYEVIDVIKIRLTEALEILNRGQLEDAKTILSLLLLSHRGFM
jgi:ADP-ribose pyrophosphatase